MLTQAQIRAHYETPSVRQTIQRVCTDVESGSRRAGNLNFFGWYKEKGDKKFKRDLTNRIDYINMSQKGRSFYWTLNFFNPEIFKIDYNTVEKCDSPEISRKYTVAYTFGIDIDKEHGKDIHDPEVKRSVEALAQFFSDKLRAFAPNSVYCLYSGGGIYILVHHKVFQSFYDAYLNDKDPEHSWDQMISVLGDALDQLICDLRDEFFRLYPEHEGNVKPDQLNNSQRVFKTIFSVHKSLDCAVIPLDPANICIDFDKAAIPLKPAVFTEAEKWYTKYDDGKKFLNELLKPFIEEALITKKSYNCTIPFTCASEPIEEVSKWAPCMRNLYAMPSCGEGATRALAAFASYLRQMGIKEEKARSIFFELGHRWGADTSNIFESCYLADFHVPTCATLNSDSNKAYPKGRSLKILHVCQPDARCLCIPSPRYYSDTNADAQRLLSRLDKVDQPTEKHTKTKNKAEKTTKNSTTLENKTKTPVQPDNVTAQPQPTTVATAPASHLPKKSPELFNQSSGYDISGYLADLGKFMANRYKGQTVTVIEKTEDFLHTPAGRKLIFLAGYDQAKALIEDKCKEFEINASVIALDVKEAKEALGIKR